MESNQDASLPLSAPWESKNPLVLITQLMQQITSIQHVDEVFSWVANAMVQHLNISVVQFWTKEVYHAGYSRIEVRAAASQDTFLPRRVYMNQQIARVVEYLLREERGVASLPVETIFASQAFLLTQSNIRYWAGYFLQDNALLPSPQFASSQERMATPLATLVSFFTQYPLSASQLRAITFLLDQALRIAIDRGFLMHSSTGTFHKNNSLTLLDLIPRRARNIEQLQADNPFTSSVIISDKNARRLYAAIDDKKTVAELALITHLDQQADRQVLIDALSYLFQQGQIRFYTQEGKQVEDLSFPRS